MKTNKVLGLALLFSAISVGVVTAQEQKQVKDPQDVATKHVERMKQALNLTDDQVAKMKQIESTMFKERQQMQKAVQDVRKDFATKMKGHSEEMQKILSPEQFQKYKNRMQRMKDRMDGYRMGMRDARGMGPMRHDMHKQGRGHQAPADGQKEATPNNDAQPQSK